VGENVCKKCKWLHTSEDLILIAKLFTNHIFLKDLLEGDHNQQVKQSPCIVTEIT